MAPPAEQFGVKVVVIDVPRPQIGVWMPDIGPGDDPEDAIRRSLRSSAANLPKLQG
jgi:hypothetical protein